MKPRNRRPWLLAGALASVIALAVAGIASG
jgi:hypothetical protein